MKTLQIVRSPITNCSPRSAIQSKDWVMLAQLMDKNLELRR